MVSVTQLQDGSVLSGSWDGTIKSWDVVKSMNQSEEDEFSNVLRCTSTATIDVAEEDAEDDQDHTVVKILSTGQLKDGRVVTGSADGALVLCMIELPARCITNFGCTCREYGSSKRRP